MIGPVIDVEFASVSLSTGLCIVRRSTCAPSLRPWKDARTWVAASFTVALDEIFERKLLVAVPSSVTVYVASVLLEEPLEGNTSVPKSVMSVPAG